jgi:ABC-2 type transport system ATP-binding protein
VQAVEPVPGGLRITATDPAAELLAKLAEASVTRLRSHEPSLEQIFLGFYREPQVREPVAAGAR